MFHPFCHSIPCPSWTDNTVKSGQFLSPSGLWGKWVRKIQKTSLEANSTIFVIVYILANYCSLSTCWLALSGQFLNPKMGNKSKLKISKLRIIIHQPNDNLSVESKRSSKTKILQISNIYPIIEPKRVMVWNLWIHQQWIQHECQRIYISSKY